jgi:FkbM family methyltransferase
MSLETFSYTIGPHGLWVRGDEPWHSQDLKVLREVIDEDCYRLADIKSVGRVPTVVDIGCHIGGFMLACHRRWPGMRYLGADMNQQNASMAMKAAFGLHRMRYDASFAAVDYGDGTPTFFDSIVEGGTATGASRVEWSETKQVWAGDHPVAKTNIIPGMVTLDDFVEAYLTSYDEIDILKLDCEGAEHRIIDGFRQWDRVGVVLVEYHGRDEWNKRINGHRVLGRWWRSELSRREDKSIGIERFINPHIRCAFDTRKLVAACTN